MRLAVSRRRAYTNISDAIVRNGKADEWAEKYADRIQQHLNAKEESFSIDADNQSFPPSISGIQNGIVAHAMNQKEWKTGGTKVELTATSNVTKESNIKWSAKYELKAEYQNSALEKIVPDGAYRIVSTIDPSSGVAATASGCSMSKAPTALRFAYDEGTGLYTATAGGLALAMSGSDVSLAAPDGSASQRWRLVASAGGYSLVNAGTGRALDDRWRDTGPGALVWGFGSNPGDPAQTWTLQAV